MAWSACRTMQPCAKNYITSKYAPKRKIQDIEVISIADVLGIYLDAELAKLHDRFPGIRKFKKRIGRLNEWWGAKMLADVNGERCRKWPSRLPRAGHRSRASRQCRAPVCAFL